MKFFNYLCLFFYLFANIAIGQNIKIDSLKREIKKNENNYEAYYELINTYRNAGDSQSILNLSHQLNNKKSPILIGLANNFKAKYYEMVYDLKNADAYCNRALYVFRHNKAFYNYAETLYFQSEIKEFLGNSKEGLECLNKAKQALAIVKPSKDKDYLAFSIEVGIGLQYLALNEYDKSYAVLSLSVLNNKQNYNLIDSYWGLSKIFNVLGNYKKSIKYNLLSKKECEKEKDSFNLVTQNLRLSLSYFEINKIDSCDYFNREALKIHRLLYKNDSIGKCYYIQARISLLQKRYSTALFLNEKSLNIHQFYNDKVEVAYNNYLFGEIYFDQGNIKKAACCFEKALLDLDKLQTKGKIKALYYKLAIVYSKLNESLLVEKYLKKIDSIGDIINLNESKNKIAELELVQLKKSNENEIQIKNLKIENQKTNQKIAISIAAVLLLLLIFSFFIYKRNIKRTQNQIELNALQQDMSIMELQNLNQQLNPHEIKNLLASIAPQIQTNSPDAYMQMVKLLNITKSALNSKSITDTIENQIKQVEDFISLEKGIVATPFDYKINNTIENNQIEIPRLLLKNMVENSIKHGIKTLTDRQGKIKIKLFQIAKYIVITIEDNGLGLNDLNVLETGIGITTYKKLFEILNKKNNEKASFEIIDKKIGTRVEIKIPLDYNYL